MILPAHEQHWPDKLLPHRLEEFVLDAGPPTQDKRYGAKRVTGQQVLDAVTRQQAALGLANIDPRYYVGTCFHEAGCSNEWDTEVATSSCPEGFVSVGAFQIGDEEARRFGFRLADMLDLEKSTACMVRLAEYNRTQVRIAAKLAGDAPDPDYVDPAGRTWKAGAMRAYLAITHNHGVGFMRKTVFRYGLDWPGFKVRNPTDNIVEHRYGEDCATGGPQWPSQDADTSRVLQVSTPPMRGDDVAAVQRKVGIPVDGVYGPMTANAVERFQVAHNLVPDGTVGPVTRAALGV